MPKNPPELTAARLRELLSYDPETGIFRRLVSTSSTARAGDVAGGLNSEGYVRIRVDGVSYRAHRLAWLYVHGRWPTDQLDHRNGVRADNRIANLREATNVENGQNYGVRKSNTSGHTGIHWHIRARKWVAQIRHTGRIHDIGYFDDMADAVSARAKAKAEMHPFQPYVRAPQPKDAP